MGLSDVSKRKLHEFSIQEEVHIWMKGQTCCLVKAWANVANWEQIQFSRVLTSVPVSHQIAN